MWLCDSPTFLGMVGELEQELMVGFFKPMWLLNFEFTCSCNIVLLVAKYDYWYMISFTKWVGWGPEAVVVYRNIDKYWGFSIIDISIFLFSFFCYFDIPKSIRYFWRPARNTIVHIVAFVDKFQCTSFHARFVVRVITNLSI